MIEKGMNNPDCSFFVGSTVGQWTWTKYLVYILCFVVLYKLVGNITQLAWDNGIRALKKRWGKVNHECKEIELKLRKLK